MRSTSARQSASSGLPGLRSPKNIAMVSPSVSKSSTDVTMPSPVGFLTTHVCVDHVLAQVQVEARVEHVEPRRP